jgi:hypothetical protein
MLKVFMLSASSSHLLFSPTGSIVFAVKLEPCHLGCPEAYVHAVVKE